MAKTSYSAQELERLAQDKKEQKIKDLFLHELALLLLAETPIKSAVRNRAKGLRGEIYYSLQTEEREIYSRSRDVILEFARSMAQAKNLESIAHALTYVQDLFNGEVLIVDDNQLVLEDAAS